MIKTIPASKLRLGMYLCRIEAQNDSATAADKTPQPGILNNQEQLDILLASPDMKVQIDTEKGSDELESGLYNLKNRIEISIPRKPHHPLQAEPLPEVEPTTLEEELHRARSVQKQAKELVQHVFHGIKVGRAVPLQEMREIVEQMSESILANHNALLLLGKIRSKSNYAFEHAVSVCSLLLSYCKWKQVDRETTYSLGMAGLLHDIGEIQLDDRVIEQKGHLDDIEYLEMQQHVQLSLDILSSCEGIPALSLKLIEQHHERLDGSGYPAHLSGDAILPMAQLLGIVDVYDSMTSETLYRFAMPPTQVLKELLESGDQMFRNELIREFIKCVGIYPVGSLVRVNNGCIGLVQAVDSSDTLRPEVKLIYNARNEHFIRPLEVNLAQQESDDPLTITGCVDPNQLHINLAAFI